MKTFFEQKIKQQVKDQEKQNLVAICVDPDSPENGFKVYNLIHFSGNHIVFEMINLIPLHRSFRNEDDLFESTWGRKEIAESNEFDDLNDNERKIFLMNIKN